MTQIGGVVFSSRDILEKKNTIESVLVGPKF